MDRIKLIQDHPRLRGEYLVFMVGTAIFTGSPPLARGVPLAIPYISNHFRITPACAGSTALCSFRIFVTKDHPRLRGEYSRSTRFAFFKPGSPPLARGVRQLASAQNVYRRITPACAGSTGENTVRRSFFWDHPRLRGEYWKNSEPLASK